MIVVKEQERILILDSILKVTIIMIIVSVFLKLFGLNLFDLDLENKILNNICNFLLKNNLDNIIGIPFMFIEAYILLSLMTEKDEVKKLFLGAIIFSLINYVFQGLIFSKYGYEFYTPFNLLVYIIISSFIVKVLLIKRPSLIMLVIFTFQLFSLFLRNITFNDHFTIMYDFLFNFDYMILLIISYYLYLKKGSALSWTYSKNYSTLRQSDGADLSSDRKTSSKKSLKKFLLLSKNNLIKAVNFSSLNLKNTILKLKDKLQMFSEGKLSEKIFVVVYIILSVLYELANLAIIVFIAFLNNSAIECLFILSSFLITKKIFGTPFHFDSAIKCFVISNLTYYILNRITIGIGISFVIPITLGILLSYITSKFVKEKNTELYRGMPKEDLLNICEDKLNKYEISLLTDYYCNRITITGLAVKYHYSNDAIYKHKRKALKKLEEHD